MTVMRWVNISFQVPIVLRTSWTGASAYLQQFVMSVVLTALSCTLKSHIIGHLVG
jgi:hypothetical protein